MNNHQPKILLGVALQATAARLLRPFARQNKKQIKAAPSEGETGGEGKGAEQDNLAAPLRESGVKAQDGTDGTSDGQTSAKDASEDSFRRAQMRQNQTMVVTTVFIALATVVSAAVAVYQWRAMEKSLQISQRAYLIVHDIQTDLEAGQIKITLENIGHVPADHFEVRVSVERRDEHFMSIEHVTVEHTTVTEVWPGNFKPQITYQLKNFGEENAALIRAGKEELILIIVLTYEDGFGNPELSSLYFRYSPNEGWTMLLPGSERVWKQSERNKENENRPEEKQPTRP